MDGTDAGEMKIDELARRTGMTVRNIRAHQSRGLLPPPEVRGRTGYYGPDHIARIKLIRELQADGLNLEAIRLLVADAGSAGEEVLDFARLLRAPFEDEEPEIVEAVKLAEQWSVTDPRRAVALARRGEELGLMRPVGRGRIELISPRLMRAAAELAALGITPERAFEVAAAVRGHAEAVARTYLDLFLTTVWADFDRAGRPVEDWPKVIAALQRLRPLVTQSFLAIFNLAMSATTEEALDRLAPETLGDEIE